VNWAWTAGAGAPTPVPRQRLSGAQLIQHLCESVTESRGRLYRPASSASVGFVGALGARDTHLISKITDVAVPCPALARSVRRNAYRQAATVHVFATSRTISDGRLARNLTARAGGWSAVREGAALPTVGGLEFSTHAAHLENPVLRLLIAAPSIGRGRATTSPLLARNSTLAVNQGLTLWATPRAASTVAVAAFYVGVARFVVGLLAVIILEAASRRAGAIPGSARPDALIAHPVETRIAGRKLTGTTGATSGSICDRATRPVTAVTIGPALAVAVFLAGVAAVAVHAPPAGAFGAAAAGGVSVLQRDTLAAPANGATGATASGVVGAGVHAGRHGPR
jgi:hypothetical protein